MQSPAQDTQMITYPTPPEDLGERKFSLRSRIGYTYEQIQLLPVPGFRDFKDYHNRLARLKSQALHLSYVSQHWTKVYGPIMLISLLSIATEPSPKLNSTKRQVGSASKL